MTWLFDTSVKPCAVPTNSAIARELPGAYFYDSYQRKMQAHPHSAMQLYLNIVVKTPGWVNAMMALRNRIVGLFGLKNLGHLGNLKKSKPASAYRVGDRVGIFSLLYLSEHEIILGESDKHLDVKVSLLTQTDKAGQSAILTTTVHVHNRLGRVYMFFVAPVHKIIAPAMLRRWVQI
jgi:hypothetical protein